MPHQIIHSVSLSQSEILEVDKTEVISNYISLSSIIKENFPESPVSLAEPVKNLNQDRINWFASTDGQWGPLESLEAEKRAESLKNIDNFINSVAELSSKLKKSSSAKQKKNGELLAGLFAGPQLCRYYLSADKILVAGWGLKSLVSLPVIWDKENPAPVMEEPAPEPSKPPRPERERVVYEKWRLKAFILKLSLGLALGIAAGLAAAYLAEPRIFRSLRAVLSAQEFNVSRFDENQNYASELRASLEDLKDSFLSRRSVCLIFSRDEVVSGDLGYLKGCWNVSGMDFINAYDGQKSSFGFCYPGQERADFKVSSQGGGQSACRGAASVSYPEEALLISGQEPLKCDPSGGDAYPPFEVQCRYSSDGSQAACNLTQKDEFSTVFPVIFRRNSK
ncbi:MAG: hypothetical protein LBP22_16490 [Deltaproteobacteria bacterium]|jgi:hypothetical protein|nr:hypothetical protein [Deltaproteobacteria bacterium]